MIMTVNRIGQLSFVALTCLLVACQNSPKLASETKQRATFADLAEAKAVYDLAAINLTKTQKQAKLTQLYQTILSLEPSKEVRAQITYRLVQIDSKKYDELDGDVFESEVDEKLPYDKKTSIDERLVINEDKHLVALILSYRNLLERFPEREDNEHIQYQLAKALGLQGKINESLSQMELLLAKYPHSQYAAELNFRRGDIYYNLQFYSKALSAFQAVLDDENNQAYYINSMYMLGWTLFKSNKLAKADSQFIAVLDYLVSQEKVQPYEDNFRFSSLNTRYQGLVSDIERVLSISLSQQQQSVSLLSLLSKEESNPQIKYLYLYRHLLFKNLANFLIENELKHDGELTYQAYIERYSGSLWASRFSIELLSLYQQQGKYSAARTLQQQYVQRYGLTSQFWQQAMIAKNNALVNERVLVHEVLPNLLNFSYQHSRRLYAKAQALAVGTAREQAFAETANWLSTYLSIAKLKQSEFLIADLAGSKGILADELLFADACFEAKHYQQALSSYQYIAYDSPLAEETEQSATIYLNAAYATTVSVRALLAQLTPLGKSDNKLAQQQKLLQVQQHLDGEFIEHFPNDPRALVLAIQAAQIAFNQADYPLMKRHTDYILQFYGVIAPVSNNKALINNKVPLNNVGLKQVQIASQLQANSSYQREDYQQAEQGYVLALHYVDKNNANRKVMRDLLASSIYFQAQQSKKHSPSIAVEHYLRLGVVIPESSYRATAEFDAANILLSQNLWQQAVDVLLNFQKQYPQHEYSSSIPAKLAMSYEQLEQWQLAAVQLLIMTQGQASSELKREAQYNAAQFYLKAGNLSKAIITFRAYAHSYPKPFDVAQEVRYKMSQFYQQTNEPNKQYYWYRKLIKFHDDSSLKQGQNIYARSAYLASIAALGLGEAHQQTFTRAKLTLPLKTSLRIKQKQMKSAIHYYQKLLTYQLAEFVPHGTFNLAQMYTQLAVDVMSSVRPKDLDDLALEEYELILEEIAYPFEEKSIEIHVSNSKRAWQDTYDHWIAKSFAVLAELEPAQYNKQEREINAVIAIY